MAYEDLSTYTQYGTNGAGGYFTVGSPNEKLSFKQVDATSKLLSHSISLALDQDFLFAFRSEWTTINWGSIHNIVHHMCLANSPGNVARVCDPMMGQAIYYLTGHAYWGVTIYVTGIGVGALVDFYSGYPESYSEHWWQWERDCDLGYYAMVYWRNYTNASMTTLDLEGSINWNYNDQSSAYSYVHVGDGYAVSWSNDAEGWIRDIDLAYVPVAGGGQQVLIGGGLMDGEVLP